MNGIEESAVVVTEEASPWAHGLSPERRAAIKELHQLRPAWNLVALVFAGLWAITGWSILRFPFWQLRIPGVLLIGVCVHSLAILMHEGVHGNLFRRRIPMGPFFAIGAVVVAVSH